MRYKPCRKKYLLVIIDSYFLSLKKSKCVAIKNDIFMIGVWRVIIPSQNYCTFDIFSIGIILQLVVVYSLIIWVKESTTLNYYTELSSPFPSWVVVLFWFFAGCPHQFWVSFVQIKLTIIEAILICLLTYVMGNAQALTYLSSLL